MGNEQMSEFPALKKVRPLRDPYAKAIDRKSKLALSFQVAKS